MFCYTTKRETCRLCRHPLPTDTVLDLGALCVNAFPRPDEPDTPKAPLELVLCQKCTLFQLRHTVNPDTLYRDVFWYRSGTTRTMQDALLDLKIDCCNHVALAPDDVVVDVGSNDSTLLKYYRGDLVRVGFEPAKNLMGPASLGARDLVIVNDYFSAAAYHARMGKRPAKLVTAAAMFYDLDDPVRFIKDVRDVLHDDGVFCVQVAYLPDTLRTNDFGNVCHEHLTYLSVRSIGSILAAGGLYPWDCSFNPTNGGSVRVFAGVKPRSPSMAYYKALEEEEAMGLVEPDRYLDPYTDFAVRVRKLRDDVRDAVAEAGRRGFVHALGASTKGNTMLQYWGFGKTEIAAASDRDPAKHGRFTVGTRIPIISEEESHRTAKTYLVLPWYFRDEIVAREKTWLAYGPGRSLIFPAPTLQAVGAS